MAAGAPDEMEGSSTYRALAWSDADDIPDVAPTDPYDYPDGQAYAGGVTGARPQLQFGEPEPAAAADVPWYRRPAVALGAGVLAVLAALAVAVFVLRDDDTPAPSSTTTQVTTTTEVPATTTVAPPPAERRLRPKCRRRRQRRHRPLGPSRGPRRLRRHRRRLRHHP